MNRRPFVILGCGAGDGTGIQRLHRRSGTVRFADPAAWATARAVDQALVNAGPYPDREAIGLIVVGTLGPRQTLLEIASMACTGTCSALRFPAANPGTLAALPCIVGGLRGPSLNLAMPLERGLPLGQILADGWLTRGGMAAVVLTACISMGGQPLTRSLMLASGPTRNDMPQGSAKALAWLAFRESEGGTGGVDG